MSCIGARERATLHLVHPDLGAPISRLAKELLEVTEVLVVAGARLLWSSWSFSGEVLVLELVKAFLVRPSLFLLLHLLVIPPLFQHFL